jgi:hypothetical protein
MSIITEAWISIGVMATIMGMLKYGLTDKKKATCCEDCCKSK